MKLLDRYVLRNFLQVYLYCIAGFISIWLIFDISDNISTFLDEHISLFLVGRYYATQVPQVFIILLPVSLLLYPGPDVARERSRVHVDRGRKSSARSPAIDRHGAAHGGSEHGAKLFAGAARGNGAQNISLGSAGASRAVCLGTNLS